MLLHLLSLAAGMMLVVAAAPVVWRVTDRDWARAEQAQAVAGPGGLAGFGLPAAGPLTETALLGTVWKPPAAGAVPIPVAALGTRGTLCLWFKLERELRIGSGDFPLLRSDAITLVASERNWGTAISAGFGKAMSAVGEKSQRVAPGQTLLTHLKGGRWYHLALAWDAARQEARLFLNGVAMNDFSTPPFGPAQGSVAIPAALASPGVAVAGLEVAATAGDAAAVAALARAQTRSALPALADEGPRHYQERLRVEDFPDKRLIYHTDFTDAAAGEEWILEGRGTKAIVGGRLVVRSNAPTPADPEPNHLVCWLRRGLPADFLASWTFQPKDPQKGLAIVFFNARGRKGEEIFDPALPPRDGNFAQYHSGALNCYHISYWSGERGTVNLRKNYGFYLAAIGDDPVSHMRPGEWARVVLLKRGNQVRLAINGRLCLAFDDDGKTYGPVHTHSGKLGLRQMVHAEECRYGEMTVWALR